MLVKASKPGGKFSPNKLTQPTEIERLTVWEG